MEIGFLTKTNKFELIETLIKPTIQQRYQLTIENIPNFTRIYDNKARQIDKLNPTNTLIEKNMSLLKELIGMFKTMYENNLEEHRIKEQQIERSVLDKVIHNDEIITDNLVKNEILSDTNNMRHLYPSNSQKEYANDGVNEGIIDKELGVNDTNIMLNDLLKQRDLDINLNFNNDNVLEDNQSNKITQPLNDNIIELDDDMTFKIKFNKTKKPKTILLKKILLLVDELDEAVLDIPYFIVTVGSNSRYFFNNGLNGNSCVFDAYLDFPIDIQREDSLMLELTTTTGDVYKQKNISVYLNY